MTVYSSALTLTTFHHHYNEYSKIIIPDTKNLRQELSSRPICQSNFWKKDLLKPKIVTRDLAVDSL